MSYKDVVKTLAPSWPTEWDVMEMAAEGLHKVGGWVGGWVDGWVEETEAV